MKYRGGLDYLEKLALHLETSGAWVSVVSKGHLCISPSFIALSVEKICYEITVKISLADGAECRIHELSKRSVWLRGCEFASLGRPKEDNFI